MPHYKHVAKNPHPQNPNRTTTLQSLSDCPRCGGDCSDVEWDGPDSLFHCPHCKGGLVTCVRIEDSDDRSKDAVMIAWIAPAGMHAPQEADCCAGCDFLAARKAVAP